ncbi:MAG: hypothetical protein H0T46_10455 [Deltaproteobacteria bacterium]|nr:hypothetical protein [Deltaproteobacteria bacterium]
MRSLVAVVALLSGCDRVFGLERELDAMAPQRCFGKNAPNGNGLVGFCVDGLLEDEYLLPQDVDTDELGKPECTAIVTQMDLDSTEICVIAANNIRVQGAPTLHGGRPLVLVARKVLTVDAGTSIDVASRSNMLGSGSPMAICSQTNNGAPGSTGGAGGAGGGFNGMGGSGGNAMVALGGSQPPAVALSNGIRAGCRGGRGGNGNSGVNGGQGGQGGGALYLIAGERIEMNGIINASGEGGGGGARAPSNGGGGAGGGGGGTGGLIGLDAPIVRIGASARLAANGGGGGGGGATVGTNWMPGTAGSDSTVFQGTFPFKAAGGMAGLPQGATGGDGSAGLAIAQQGASATSGGGAGGGGGAPGYILIYTPDGGLENASTQITPAFGP